jgi:hypothetical protein
MLHLSNAAKGGVEKPVVEEPAVAVGVLVAPRNRNAPLSATLVFLPHGGAAQKPKDNSQEHEKRKNKTNKGVSLG